MRKAILSVEVDSTSECRSIFHDFEFSFNYENSKSIQHLPIWACHSFLIIGMSYLIQFS